MLYLRFRPTFTRRTSGAYLETFKAVNLAFRHNVVFSSVPYIRRVVACLSGSLGVDMRVLVDKVALGHFFFPSTSVVPSQ